jgi:hypothetical protein
MIHLRNGAKPIIHHAWRGGRGERHHLGLVLAVSSTSYHPYVTWLMASDDGRTWDCFAGAYCMTVGEGFRSYRDRREGVPGV